MQLKYGPYSPSRLEVATCPYSFYRSYIKKDVASERELPANRGSVVHEMLELITKGWTEEKPLSWEDVRKILPKLMGKYHITNQEVQQTITETARCYLNNPPSGIEDIVGTEEGLALKQVENAEGEEQLVECTWDDPNCVVRGKIDILQIKDTTATIIDHKTQLFIPKNLGTFQMGVYAWLVTEFYPFVKEVKTVLHFCDHQRNLYTEPFSWTLSDLKIIKNDFLMAVDIIENITDFEKTEAGTHCAYCDVKRECPLLVQSLKDKTSPKKTPILNAKHAQEKASTLHTLEVNKGVLQSELKDFTSEIGPIIIPGVEYGYKISEGWEVPLQNKKDLFDMLNRLGVDVWEYLNFDIKSLGKGVWRHLKEQDIEQIKSLLKPVKKTRFGGRKV